MIKCQHLWTYAVFGTTLEQHKVTVGCSVGMTRYFRSRIATVQWMDSPLISTAPIGLGGGHTVILFLCCKLFSPKLQNLWQWFCVKFFYFFPVYTLCKHNDVLLAMAP
jgi:hypothetical protein